MEPLKRVRLPTALTPICDIKMLYYNIAYGGQMLRVPIETIEPFENILPDDEFTDMYDLHFQDRQWKN